MLPDGPIFEPITSIKVSRYHIPSHGGFPNTSLSPRPLIIYHSAFLPSATPATVSVHLRQIGEVEPEWTYTMYTTPHFHSNTHELLVVISGSALLQFGGPANPDRVETTVERGDVMIVPAGVAHAMLQDGGGFRMLGCYPIGAEGWDHYVGAEGELGKEMEERIGRLRWFKRDPIYGDEGSVLTEG